jgi:hypothetical protein
MSSGKLVEPRVITDFNQNIVCILPIGFYFDDGRWEQIWQRYEEKGESLSMADLKQMFPDEPTVQHAARDTGEKFGSCK